MKVIDPGHIYEPDSIDGACKQTIVFVKREGDKWPGNEGHHAGTTFQELLRIMLDRFRYVNSQLPCAETQACMYLAETMLLLLEVRAARVHNRSLDIMHLAEVDQLEPCPACGHLQCGDCTAEQRIKAIAEKGQ